MTEMQEPIHIIITIHGIRTYGRWQSRLRDIVYDRAHSNGKLIEVLSYRYGVFTLLSFLVPYLRSLAVKQFKNYLESLFDEKSLGRVDIVAHSFGTYLALEALANTSLADNVRINTCIFCGSAISPNHSLARLVGPKRRIGRIINECGIFDGVLLLTLLVYGVGMAGRLGFQGFEGRWLWNRYHRLGHSGYFERSNRNPYDGFINRWWLPILLDEAPIKERDRRPAVPTLADRVWRVLGENGASFAVAIYSAILLSLAITFASLWQSSETAKREALSQRNRALSQESFALVARARERLRGDNLAGAYLLAAQAVDWPAAQPTINRPRVKAAEDLIIEIARRLGSREFYASALAFDRTGQRLAVLNLPSFFMTGVSLQIYDLKDGAISNEPSKEIRISDERLTHARLLQFTPSGEKILLAGESRLGGLASILVDIKTDNITEVEAPSNCRDKPSEVSQDCIDYKDAKYLYSPHGEHLLVQTKRKQLVALISGNNPFFVKIPDDWSTPPKINDGRFNSDDQVEIDSGPVSFSISADKNHMLIDSEFRGSKFASRAADHYRLKSDGKGHQVERKNRFDTSIARFLGQTSILTWRPPHLRRISLADGHEEVVATYEIPFRPNQRKTFLFTDPKAHYAVFGREFDFGDKSVFLDLESRPPRIHDLLDTRTLGLSEGGGVVVVQKRMERRTQEHLVLESTTLVLDPTSPPASLESVVPPIRTPASNAVFPSTLDNRVTVLPSDIGVTVITRDNLAAPWVATTIDIPIGPPERVVLSATGSLLAVPKGGRWSVFDLAVIGSRDWQRSEVLKRAEEKLDRCLRKRELSQMDAATEDFEALINDGASPKSVMYGQHRCPLLVDAPG